MELSCSAGFHFSRTSENTRPGFTCILYGLLSPHSGHQHVKCENRGMFKIIYFQVKTVQGSSQPVGQSQGYYDYSRNKFVLPNGRRVTVRVNKNNKARGKRY